MQMALATSPPRAARRATSVVFGSATPRIAPPVPARSRWKEFSAFSADLGWKLRPWQDTAARYLTAEARDQWLYREVAIIVARQNGKTTILVPLIVSRLLAGQRIMHTAQNRELPREVHMMVADLISDKFSDQLRSRPRFANGQEEIRLRNGGVYRIVAPTRGGARGPSNDLVIVDELREMVDHDFIAAAKPTLTASPRPQMVYLSNAGTEDSEVLNAIKKRAGEDPSLAYLEWSAAPERDADDIKGWIESNPSLGHDPAVLLTLQNEYRTHSLAGTIGIYETEHLCRWVVTLQPRLVSDAVIAEARQPLEVPRRPVLGIGMDPNGTRAAAVLAWVQSDSSVAYRVLADVHGSPIDTARFGNDLRLAATKAGVMQVGFDPQTDAELAKFFKKPESVNGQKWANASAQFVNLAEGGRLRWDGSGVVSEDLVWVTRKTSPDLRSFTAVPASDDRAIPAALAAIRAVWLASGPKPPRPRIY
jgi:hypothetical protein